MRRSGLAVERTCMINYKTSTDAYRFQLPSSRHRIFDLAYRVWEALIIFSTVLLTIIYHSTLSPSGSSKCLAETYRAIPFQVDETFEHSHQVDWWPAPLWGKPSMVIKTLLWQTHPQSVSTCGIVCLELDPVILSSAWNGALVAPLSSNIVLTNTGLNDLIGLLLVRSIKENHIKMMMIGTQESISILATRFPSTSTWVQWHTGDSTWESMSIGDDLHWRRNGSKENVTHN